MAKRVRRSAEFWRQAVGEQPKSGDSIAEYCRKHQLNTVTFYRWRKAVAEQGRAKRPKSSRPARRSAQTTPAAKTSLLGNARPLVELVVDSAAQTGSQEDVSRDSAPQLVEISLAGGTWLRIHGPTSADSVGQLLAAVQAAAGSGAGGR